MSINYRVSVPKGYRRLSDNLYVKHYRDINTGNLMYSFFDASLFTPSNKRTLTGVSEEQGQQLIENFLNSNKRYRAVNSIYYSSLQGKSEMRARTYKGLVDSLQFEYGEGEADNIEYLLDFFSLDDWDDFVKNYLGDDYLTDWWTQYHRYETNRLDSGKEDINSKGKKTHSFTIEELGKKMLNYLHNKGMVTRKYTYEMWLEGYSLEDLDWLEDDY